MQAAPPQPQPLATRSATACIRCRRQKTKCLHDDNGQPCRGCVKAQQQCVFPGKVPRAPRAPVIAGLPPLANTTSPTATAQLSQPQQPHKDTALPDRSDLASQLELHPSHVQDCERAFALWPFPCFHRPSFMRQLREGHLPQTLNYAILSSGARASPGLIRHFGSPGGASEYFAEKAQANINSSMDCPSVPDVQSLCLLAMHHWGSGRGIRAYIFLGMAGRMAQMFLPQATTGDEDFVAAETARRTIWTCFIMDQFLSCGNGRLPSIRAEELQIQLPCSEDDFHFGSPVSTPTLNGEVPGYTSPECPKAEVGEFGHMIRVAILWHRAVSWVTDPPADEQDDTEYHAIMGSLRQWARSLPSRQQDTPGKIDLHIQVGNGYSFAFTHSVYYCAFIFLSRKQLHRMGRRVGGRDTDADVTDVIDAIAYAAGRVTALISTLDADASFVSGGADAGAPLPAYPVVVLFAAYTAASTVANMILQGVPMPVVGASDHPRSAGGAENADAPARNIVAPVLEILRKSAPVWPLAERWHSELGRLSTRLNARGGSDAGASHERHDSHHPPLATMALNGGSTQQQHHLPPVVNGDGVKVELNGAVAPTLPPLQQLQQLEAEDGKLAPVKESEEETSERDSKAFDDHLKGLGDLATFLGTGGFRF
ncbi:fungal specific transcription factor domain containing protein [Diplodia corticola]|uniref:Fungal specific transcription factor domain containing protein n=1 Tax=Diplodia corticola TaxID=236234 RepID=A0A1J9S158_9PEZI|nr:fungal specific transcription factor domain containing protein [Diplodia corticola]OJD34319.1 fungal specific transcription factor domain containing protein [Diplodia corticola]